MSLGYGFAAGTFLFPGLAAHSGWAAEAAVNPTQPPSKNRAVKPRVAIVSCHAYGPEVRAAFKQAFDLLGGIGGLVRGKTVTIKINLTGTGFRKLFRRSVGESYMTHEATAVALCALLFSEGAQRVRLVESTNSQETLEQTLAKAGWDVNALLALGKVECENTRNLGLAKKYAHLKVPGDGYLFSAFDLNHSYEDTDVLISLCKLKNHSVAGVTLSMKNLFGMAPNSLYGDQAPNEDGTAGRGPLHDPREHNKGLLPGEKTRQNVALTQDFRVPRIVTDLCTARPISLAVIDGITTMSGGEGWWSDHIRFVTPGVILAGFDPVAADAVGTCVMGYADPRARRGVAPFLDGDNHILLAEARGLGTADIQQIEVCGLSIERARYQFG